MDHHKERLKNAQRLNLLYQERIACLTEIMDQLKDMDQYDLSLIFSIVWQELNEMIVFLTGGAIFGIKEDVLSFLATQNIQIPVNYWEKLAEQSKKLVINSLKSEDAKNVLFWNYEKDSPNLINDQSDQHAVSISFLCRQADDEDLYMLLFRNVSNQPFLSDEIQFIKIVSRIIGWHLNYEFTYQLLLYHCKKIFYPKIINTK